MKLQIPTAIVLSIFIAACNFENGKTSKWVSEPSSERNAQVNSPNTPVEPPALVVATMNRLYNDSQNNCREVHTDEPRGHYYCSGILIRGVSDGDYPPWSHGPGAIQTGASSYSWIRHDLDLPLPYEPLIRPAGFILRNPAYGAHNRLFAIDAGFICLYPFDNQTSGNTRHKGCGLKGPSIQAVFPQPVAHHHNASNAWGSCESINVTTLDSWLQLYKLHLMDGSNYHKEQCSWNVDNQAGWNNAIAGFNIIRKDYPAHVYGWNELLLNIVDDGSVLKKYMAAFYYAPELNPEPGEATPLEVARTFQRKLNANGYTVPILLLDFTSPSTHRFSYHPEDQAIPQ